MKIAYFDCFAGAAGDMIVASMLDASLDADFLKAQLARLGLKNLDIKIYQTSRAGLRALSFVPVVHKEHQHRNLKDITEIITKSGISEKAKKTALAVFEKIAKAEGKVHGKDPSEIHFHEVGALDSIVDIVSASVGFDALGLDKVYCSTLSVGGGSIECAHQLLPVPAPATTELLKGVPIIGGPGQVELLTPTAAAILTTVVDRFCPLPAMKIEAIGYGAGTLESDKFPNVLRLILGQVVDDTQANADSICVLETNIDDVSGELVGSVTEKLFKYGALDVFTTPIYMKRGRPAEQISVICKIEDIQPLEQILFEEGLTFGVRRQILQRTKLARDFVTVQTEFGQIKIKVGSLDGKVVNAKPEFADCSAAAEKHKIPLKAVLDAAMSAYKKVK
ncbi:MAG: nickel pincer cofactor biosynthesis protein LarC [Sedimentisphaerales bacterium]|nr:nickel pincer cofactor biosynthesis protein LarC [Sedimentisphaerales bacterium]